jgi:hypothetical protein
MHWLRRLVGVIVLVLSAVGIVACLAVIVGVWWFEREASQKVESVSTQLDVGLQRLSSANQDVRRVLKNARDELDQANQQAADRVGDPEKDRATNRLVRKLIQERVGPQLNTLDGRLATAADVSVVVASLLRSLQESPASQAGGISPEELETAAGRARELSEALRTLQVKVGAGEDAATDREIADAAKGVSAVLQRCEATVTDWQSHLDAASKELPQFKARVLRWLLLGAVVVTALCAWFTLAQGSLFAHAWKWCRGA